MSNPNTVPHTRWCETHGKKGFTKDNAKKLLRMIKSRNTTGMREYPCGLYWGLWHVGHLPQATLLGEKTAGEVYRPRRDAA